MLQSIYRKRIGVLPGITRGVTPILLRGYPKTAWEFATLAHEAHHAVKYIMRDINETEADEVIGHSIGAVVRDTLESRP